MAAAATATAPAATMDLPPTLGPIPAATAGRDVPATSIAARGTNPGEVTVQFKRWHSHGQTAYQKGQFAGFNLAVAEKMEASGIVLIDPGYRREAVNRMVRK